MKRNVKIIIAVVLAYALAVTGAVLVTRSQLKATDETDVSYAAQDETTESVTVVELVSEITEDTEEETDILPSEEVSEELEEDVLVSEEESEEIGEIAEEEDPTEEAEGDGRNSFITTNLDGAETVSFGMEVILTLNLEGYEDTEVQIQWQRSLDGENWEMIAGETGMDYRFTLSEENYEYFWRANVTPLS